MKKSDFKKLIKPIVKECIQESLLEDGILSKVISEVAMGLNSGNNLVKESKKPAPQEQIMVNNSELRESEPMRELKAQRQEMLDAIGTSSFNGVDLFEGTDPLSTAGEPGTPSAPASALSGVDPKDPGVDISTLAGVFGNTWRTISNG